MAATAESPVAITPSSFGNLSPYLILDTISYCDLKTLTCLRATARLWAVLVAEHEQTCPSFTTLTGPLSTLGDQAKRRCSSTPSVGFLFFNERTSKPSEMRKTLLELPPKCQVIGSGCQYSVAGRGDRVLQAGEDAGQEMLSLLSLPEAHAHAFMAESKDLSSVTQATSPKKGRRILREGKLGLNPQTDYRLFVIIPSKGTQNIEVILQTLQEGYPRAAICGGVCSRNIFCWKSGILHMPGRDPGGMGSGIVGMALWGNVPLQAIVSRGLVPRSPALEVANWEYEEDEEGVLLNDVYWPPSVTASSSSSAAATKNALATFQVCKRGSPLMGVQVKVPATGAAGVVGGGGEGTAMIDYHHTPYEVLSSLYGQQGGGQAPGFFIPSTHKAEGVPPKNARFAIKVFEHSTTAAQAHVQMKMKAVARELQEKKQEMMGALLFSCSSRGPGKFFEVAKQNVDAQAFMKEFPGIPVSGLYVKSEIGPQATYLDNEDYGQEGETTNQGTSQEGTNLEDECERAIVRTGQSESYSLQLNTAVFLCFVRPKRSTVSSPLLTIYYTEGLAVAVRHVLKGGLGAGGTVGGGGASAGEGGRVKGGDGGASGVADKLKGVSLRGR